MPGQGLPSPHQEAWGTGAEHRHTSAGAHSKGEGTWSSFWSRLSPRFSQAATGVWTLSYELPSLSLPLTHSHFIYLLSSFPTFLPHSSFPSDVPWVFLRLCVLSGAQFCLQPCLFPAPSFLVLGHNQNSSPIKLGAVEWGTCGGGGIVQSWDPKKVGGPFSGLRKCQWLGLKQALSLVSPPPAHPHPNAIN